MRFLLYKLKKIQVYALVGGSGSGKSFHSRVLIDTHNIDVLIDDGLIIRDDKILSGKTAKNETTVINAVGTAIFENVTHRHEARATLRREKFRRVLILGTSEKMIHKICNALLLPPPKRIIHIEDIASPEQIETARSHRANHGSHVVPVPAFEMQQSFPNILVSSLKVLFQRGSGLFRKDFVYQKSIVRPSYSNKGTIKLSDKALLQLVSQLTQIYEESIKVNKVKFYSKDSGYNIEVYIAVPAKGINLNKILPRFHDYLIAKIQNFSGIIVRKLDIIIDTLTS